MEQMKKDILFLTSIVIIFLFVFFSSVKAATDEVGNNTYYDAAYVDYLEWVRITPTANGNLTLLGVNVRNASGEMRLAIYNNSGVFPDAKPDHLLAESDSFTVNDSSWNYAGLDNIVFLIAGEYYWIGFQSNSNSNTIYQQYYYGPTDLNYQTNNPTLDPYTYGTFPTQPPNSYISYPSAIINARIIYNVTSTSFCNGLNYTQINKFVKNKCTDDLGMIYDQCQPLLGNTAIMETYCHDSIPPYTNSSFCEWSGQFCTNGTVCNAGICINPINLPKQLFERIENCTSSSAYSYGALSCNISIPIPSDCVNITTHAYTLFLYNNETNFNESLNWGKWTCNPFGDYLTTANCDEKYIQCSYPATYSYIKRDFNNYRANQTATSYHLINIPNGCMVNQYATFSILGRLEVICYSATNYGIIINNQTLNCTHEFKCADGSNMIEVFPDCHALVIPCGTGAICESNSCIPRNQTSAQTPINTLGLGIDLGIFNFFLTPLFICFIIMLGVSGFITSKATGKKNKFDPTIFLISIIGFTLMFTIFDIFPAWIGFLLVVFAAILLVNNLRKGVIGD
jgi:hypothetical protein